MKKLLSCLLILAMMFSMFAFTTVSASEGDASVADDRIYKITKGEKTYDIDGETYNVIWSAEDFVGMTDGGKYVFGADIDLTDIANSDRNYIKGIGVEIEGNNCSIENYDTKTKTAIFDMYTNCAGKTLTLRNLTVGAEGSPIKTNYAVDNGGTAVIAYRLAANVTLDCTNVDVYAEMNVVKYCVGFFAGQAQSSGVVINLRDCAAIGKISGSAGKYGAFVGNNTNINVNLYSCTYGVEGAGLCGFENATLVVQDITVATPAVEISTAAEFLAIGGYKNYNLTADIDLGGEAFSGKAWQGTLDGNGHSVTNFSAAGGMFTSSYANRSFKDITFGTETAPIAVSNQGCGLLSGKASNSNITATNVKAYVSINTTTHQMGGFIGFATGCTLTFIGCEIDGALSAAHKHGGYVGNAQGTDIVFENCVNRVDVSGTGQNCGGFVGLMDGAAAQVSLKNCINEGNITAGSFGAGGAIGKAGAKDVNVKVTVDNFLNLGKITAPETSTNTFVGAVVGAKVEFGEYSGSINAYSLAGSLKHIMVEGEAAVNGDVTVNEVTAEQLASGEVAYKLGAAFGQTLGVDETPVLGGAKVAERVIGEDTYYANLVEGNTPAVYAQYRNSADAGKHDHRILINVSDDYLNEVTDATIRIEYKLASGKTKFATLSLDDISFYTVVGAAGGLCTGAEGTVLMAVVINNVPDADWTEYTVTLSVEGSDAAVGAYAATATFKNN